MCLDTFLFLFSTRALSIIPFDYFAHVGFMPSSSESARGDYD